MPSVQAAVANGEDLDVYLNSVDMTLNEILDNITAINPEVIPSDQQRIGFLMLCALLRGAHSLTGTMRYDVLTTHEGCKYHDDHVRQSVARIKQTIDGI